MEDSSFGAIIGSQAYGGLCKLLSVRFFLESANTSFVVFATTVLIKIVRVRKVLCTFDAVEAAQAGKIFSRFRLLVLLQMSWTLEILLDLVKVTIYVLISSSCTECETSLNLPCVTPSLDHPPNSV